MSISNRKLIEALIENQLNTFVRTANRISLKPTRECLRLLVDHIQSEVGNAHVKHRDDSRYFIVEASTGRFLTVYENNLGEITADVDMRVAEFNICLHTVMAALTKSMSLVTGQMYVDRLATFVHTPLVKGSCFGTP